MTQMPAELLAAARNAGLYPVLTMPGGEPLSSADGVLGAIGVAGAAPEVDAECARIAAATLA
jgi:uncharacterized protein GlcG (DUF336 family)